MLVRVNLDDDSCFCTCFTDAGGIIQCPIYCISIESLNPLQHENDVLFEKTKPTPGGHATCWTLMVNTCSFERKIFWIGSQVTISSLSLKCNINQQSMNIVKLSAAQLQFIMVISWVMMSVDLLSHDASHCAAAAVWLYSSFTMMMQWHYTLTLLYLPLKIQNYL